MSNFKRYVVLGTALAVAWMLSGCAKSSTRGKAAMDALNALATLDKIDLADPGISVEQYESYLNHARQSVREASTTIGNDELDVAGKAALDAYADALEVWKEGLKNGRLMAGTELMAKLQTKYWFQHLSETAYDPTNVRDIKRALKLISNTANSRLENFAAIVFKEGIAADAYKFRYVTAPTPAPEPSPRELDYRDVLKFGNRGVPISVTGYIDPADPSGKIHFDQKYFRAKLCPGNKPRCDVMEVRYDSSDKTTTESYAGADYPALYIPMTLMEPIPQNLTRLEDIRYRTADGKGGNPRQLVRITGVVKSDHGFGNGLYKPDDALYVREIRWP